jgi:hypothetical protein
MTTRRFDGTTGSMACLTEDTIGGFNTWLRATKRASAGRPTLLTLHLFDDRHEYPYIATPLRRVKKLTHDVYYARGSTALLDAYAAEINRLDRVVGKRDRALILVITDGFENASREVTAAHVRRAIQQHERLPNWTFQYIGANQDAFAVGRDLGMTANMVSARGDAAGVAATYRYMSANASAFVASDDLSASDLSQADYDAAFDVARSESA